jgi:hypothetical protein
MVSEKLGSIMRHCIVYKAHVHAENLDPEHVMAAVVSAAVSIEPKCCLMASSGVWQTLVRGW